MTVDDIFDKFGMNSALGRAIGVSNIRASGIRARGRIPPEYWVDLMDFCELNGVDLTYKDLALAHRTPGKPRMWVKE